MVTTLYNHRVNLTPQVRLDAISVRFGALQALSEVSLTLHPGERHAIVGENGAGKSTLMNVLFGKLAPTTGRLFLDGVEQTLSSPREAMGAGIGMVHQHFDLIGPFTVWENVVLGAEPTASGGRLDRAQARAQVAALAERSQLKIDPDARVETLSVAGQQRTEILKALWRDARVLILDEPTAVLAPSEARELWATVERLSDEGRSIVFITHKLSEVMAHADRVSVLRRGECVVAGVSTTETTPELLAQAMVGTSESAPAPSAPAERNRAGMTLQLKNLHVRGTRGDEAVQGITLEVLPGEILGLAGVDGSGQTELIEAIAGLRPATGSATLAGTDLLALSVAQRRAMGVSLLPDDRLRLALAPSQSVAETAVLGRQREPGFSGRFGLLRVAKIQAFTTERIAAFDVRGAEPESRVGALSGGNQQKLVLARELSRQPTLLLASQPTRGLDFAATSFVHGALRAERDRGAAILLASLDLSELLELCDRIAVFLAGKIVGVVRRADATEERLGQLMTGASR